MEQLTKDEWFTVNSCLCDVLALYTFHFSNTGDKEYSEKIQAVGKIVRKTHQNCLQLHEESK